MAQLKYPLEESSYKLLEEIGSGVSAIVFKAICLPMNSIVAIKAIDLDRSRADFDNIRREAKAMSLLSHPKILKAHCSFTVNRLLWVVMPFMSAGSLQSIINSSFPNGLPEPCIAFVLKEILYALLYLHDQGHLHRDIKAGNILIDSDGSVKLADFGVSASIYESKHTSSISSSSSSSLMLNDVAGTPYWMAPEVIHSHTGYSFKADIWSFGITALELAHGRPPLSHLPPSKSLIMRITSRFLISDYEKHNKEKNKKFSKNFREMVSACLDQDPSKRPTAERLLKHPFFKNCKNADFLVKNVLQGLPIVEERFKKSKVDYPLQSHEESSEEEESQGDGTIVKHRRISGWNFNEQDLEFNPVFPTESEDDSITKRVRFGGESIIHDSESGQKERNNLQTHTTPPTQEETPANGDVGSHYPGPRRVIASQLVSSLTELQRSLEDEKQMVSNLLTNFGGGEADGVVEMSREEQLQKRVEQLTAELEQEKRKNAALEMDVELLRKRYAGAVSSCKNNG